MNILIRTLSGVILLTLLVGCTTTYRIQVDALAAPEASSLMRFVIEEPGGTGDGSRLRYLEASDLISKALTARGWAKAENPADADIMISLEAAVSEPLTQTELRSEPLYYRTWGQTRSIRTPVRDENGKITGYVRSYIYLPPQRDLLGYRDIAYNVTVYEKSLNLTAHDTAGEEVWTIQVRTVDESSDLRKYLPLLAAASLPYVGETTEGEIVVKVSEKDETLAHLRTSDAVR